MNAERQNALVEALALELERPRPLSPQVLNHLAGTYGVARDAVGEFLGSQLPGLEDYEIDLILSPIFTPGLADQAIFAGLLENEAVPATEWPTLVEQLQARPTQARLIPEDGVIHSLPLRAVTLERYVHRLRLQGRVSDALWRCLSALPPAADRPLLIAIARRAIWENEDRRIILLQYLTRSFTTDQGSTTDVVELLKLAETYEPKDVADLLSRIPGWERSLRQDMSLAASPKAFLNERVEELHGGGRDQRRQDHARLNRKQLELDFLSRLQVVLGS